ncbi:MAG: hypothetical protein ONA90_02070, partial [candidate division KSB1 bacterium]|nr:hypothetical protein [candidate division KSB1 bacterium]
MLKRFVLSRCHAVAALSCVVLAPQLVAQTKSLTRLYEPVIVTAQTLPALTNDSISVFSAYRYDSYTDQFIRVPFQIDEINANGEFLKEDDPKVAIADSNDQVVFMPGDTGDRAPTDKWVEGSANKRLELEATDPQTNQKGWLYLFRNAVSIQPVEPYVRYVPGPIGNAGADTVVGTSYVEAHNSRGWFTDTAIRTSAGGDGRDILDRQKVRVRGRYLFFDIALPEDTLQFRSVEFGGGPVRLFRKLSMAINIAGIIQTDLSFIAQYLPYHTQFGADKAEIPNIAG